MNFQIKALAADAFAPLFELSDAELTHHSALRMIADRKPGFPCRVSLRDADVGESVLLVNYEHLPIASPYRACHAIFVRERATEARLEINEIPEVLSTRLLSVRAFDDAGIMVDADVLQGRRLAAVVRRMLRSSRVRYLHAHNAKPGCFAARIERSET